MITIFVLLSRISPLIATIINIIIGFLVLLKSKNKQQGIWFFLFNLLLSIWSYSCFIQSTFNNQYFVLLFDKILYVSAILIIPTFVLLLQTFIRNKVKKLFIVSLSMALVLVPLSFSSLFRLGMIYKEGARYTIIPGIGWYLYIIMFSLITIIGLIYLIKYPLNSTLKQLPYIFVSYLFLIIAGTAYYILSLPFIQGSFLINLLNLISSIMGVVYAAIFSYAILKHELMDIRLAVTRTFSYGLVVIGIVASFIFAFYGLISFPILQLLSMLILAIFWAFTAIPLSNFLVTTAKRKFIRGYYEPDKVISSFKIFSCYKGT